MLTWDDSEIHTMTINTFATLEVFGTLVSFQITVALTEAIGARSYSQVFVRTHSTSC